MCCLVGSFILGRSCERQIRSGLENTSAQVDMTRAHADSLGLCLKWASEKNTLRCGVYQSNCHTHTHTHTLFPLEHLHGKVCAV